MNIDIDTDKYVVSESGEIIIRRDFAKLLRAEGFTRIDDFLNPTKGRKLRDIERRSNIKLELTDRTFFLKYHQASSPFDRVRALLGRIETIAPGIIEFRNITLLEKSGFPVMDVVACGEKKNSGLFGESFIMTEQIPGAEPLDDYCKNKLAPLLTGEKLLRKRAIIKELGELIRRFHAFGFNHRDLYLCHVFIRHNNDQPVLYIIDLQRMQKRKARRRRWLVKDIAQLNYSSRFAGITDRDRMRFLRSYLGGNKISDAKKSFIRKVIAKTNRIHSKIENRKQSSSKKLQ